MCGRYDIHPTVPRSAVMAFINYCHACQAFMLSVTAHTQTGDDTGRIWYDHSQTFGPFDSWEDVEDYAITFLGNALEHGEAPWTNDGGSWKAVDPDHPAAGGRSASGPSSSSS